MIERVVGPTPIMPEPSDVSSIFDGFSFIRRRVVLLSLAASFSLGQVASTIYVPSIPAIARGLHTSVAHVQFTFVGYLLAYATSMLVLGPLSDRFGRKRMLVCGFFLSALSSIACAAAPTIEVLIGARVLQAMGACAGMVVGRALTRDIWGRDAAAQVIAGCSMAATLMQAFSPVLGGYLQAWFGWRANFVVVAALACLAMALVACSLPARVTTPCQKIQAILGSYRMLITTRQFIRYALAGAGAHAGFHIFAAGAPAVLIGTFGVTPQHYGYYATLPPLGYVVGSFLSKRLTGRLGINNVIAIGATVLVPAGLSMVGLALLHVAGPFMVVGPMIVVCCGSGLITPNAAAGALGADRRMIGTASGLASFFQLTGAAIATAALAFGSSGSPLILALIIAFAGLFSVTSFGSLMPSPAISAEADAHAPI
jgi:DHA1 family bicyclomycin/chloramphenicol resistance-like MFS transporter